MGASPRHRGPLEQVTSLLGHVGHGALLGLLAN